MVVQTIKSFTDECKQMFIFPDRLGQKSIHLGSFLYDHKIDEYCESPY